MEPPTLLPPFPKGWYALGLSGELRPGELRAAQWMGEETVLFRTERGEAALMGAYCPHLGAHMGYGGRVQGETVRCPFHGFCFDTRGECASIPYGTRIPPKARAEVWPCVERHGLILAYYDPEGCAPGWIRSTGIARAPARSPGKARPESPARPGITDPGSS